MIFVVKGVGFESEGQFQPHSSKAEVKMKQMNVEWDCISNTNAI